MIQYNEIRDVHLEISSLCNARCPLCPRNFRGYPYNDGYPETNLTIEQIKKIFTRDFLLQLETIWLNGNLGDPMMNSELIEIIKFFKDHNPNLKISIHTNGSIRNQNFWNELATLKIQVIFHIDGLEDTNHLYRQGIEFKKIINNAQVYINSGGEAVWGFIIFDHNKHQLEECKQLSIKMGFINFYTIDDDRNTGPVYDTNGNLVHVMGNYQGETNFEILFHKKKTDMVLLEDIIQDRTPKSIKTCWAKQHKSIYIAANGEVSPCCKLAFFPRTYGKGEYHEAANAQIQKILLKNNAIEIPLEQCIDWFNNVQKSWDIKTYEQGRLIVCDNVCGE